MDNYRHVTLWDVDELEAMPNVRDMRVAPVGTRDVEEFARRYHYTHTGGSMLWRWGLWHDVTLLGVVAYNLPTRDVCESLFGADHFDKVWHMGRLVLADHAPHNSESRLIGGSLRAIRAKHPNVWAVVTYAATDVGHLGYVYQATNALYTGTGGDRGYFVDRHGQRHSTYLSGHVNAERAKRLGWTAHRGGVKHRYVYVLGSKSERRARLALFRYPILPYPKEKPEMTEIPTPTGEETMTVEGATLHRRWKYLQDGAELAGNLTLLASTENMERLAEALQVLTRDQLEAATFAMVLIHAQTTNADATSDDADA